VFSCCSVVSSLRRSLRMVLLSLMRNYPVPR
jgi:hypothetical protein